MRVGQLDGRRVSLKFYIRWANNPSNLYIQPLYQAPFYFVLPSKPLNELNSRYKWLTKYIHEYLKNRNHLVLNKKLQINSNCIIFLILVKVAIQPYLVFFREIFHQETSPPSHILSHHINLNISIAVLNDLDNLLCNTLGLGGNI